MSWARIMAPLTGSEEDAAVLAAAAELAALFKAEVAGVYAPVDIADVTPWMSEGFLGGVELTALEAIKASAATGETHARRSLDACTAKRKSFTALKSPVWTSLALEARLSDVVVFDNRAASGKSRLAQAFQELMAVEQRPILVARTPLGALNLAVVAWDGGKEASRAARTALPLLQKAKRCLVVSASEQANRYAPPERLQAFLAERGVKAISKALAGGDAARLILDAADEADLLVSGAFGHARIREFVFGGVTRSLLSAPAPSLFLSH